MRSAIPFSSRLSFYKQLLQFLNFNQYLFEILSLLENYLFTYQKENSREIEIEIKIEIYSLFFSLEIFF